MSILDTITSLNQEASGSASSGTEKARKALDESIQLVEEGEQDMSLVEEGDSSHDGKTLEEADEAKLASEFQESEVKTEDVQDQMELGKEIFTEEIKMEQEESGVVDQTEKQKDKIASKTGKPSEEKDEDLPKSTSQAKQKARERIKEGELLFCFLCLQIYSPYIVQIF